MSGLWRNREIRLQAALWLASGAVFSAMGFLLDVRAGILMLGASAFFILLFFGVTFWRYREIRRLGQELDEILHGRERLDPGVCREGDVAILRDEIYKMTVRLREQKEKLLGEKRYLADSLADISHQLRTPLTSLNLTVSMLQQTRRYEGREQELLREMKRLLGRVEWLVESLLKLSKLDAGSIPFCMERVDLGEFLRQAAEPLAIALELRGQQISLEAQEGSGFVGDRAWTMEAVTNVLKNCMEYNPSGETLRVRGLENPLYTEILIEDKGPGISPEDLPHLFERFYRGKSAGRDSFGIGLALSRAILARENGAITAENRTEGGSRFTIRIYKGTI